jgi:mRNA-decapping enzyme subunit 2
MLISNSHWFYEDYLRPLNPTLPSYNQRNFTHLLIASSPLYSSIGDIDYDSIWDDYCSYKRMVPCCGGILINREGDKVDLCIYLNTARADDISA